MNLTGIELRRLCLPLVTPFRTSFGVQVERDVVLLRAVAGDVGGWAECVAGSLPMYSSEYTDSAVDVLTRCLIPALASTGDVTAAGVQPALAKYRGHRMAKAALETAVLDLELRLEGRSLARELGAVRTRVPCGVSVGIADSLPELLDAVDAYLMTGYRRIKLKIKPGWDIEPVRTVREQFGDDLVLQVDANAAYSRADVQHLARLDEFGLLLLEQPLDEDDMVGHVELTRRLLTPVCLDESITSARAAATAIEIGACNVVNIKPGRVGGYLEARRIHEVCIAHEIPAWCGGMLETGIGRAANLALAALPGFVLPGDISESARYYTTDVTEPFVLSDGHLDVPTGPGIGIDPIPRVLEQLTSSVEWVPFDN